MSSPIRRYGVPYQGSKNVIVPWVMSYLPAAVNFVDVFAGGCAVTHGALLSGKYRHFIVNDLSDAPQLFLDAVHGKFKDEKRWITREQFFELKDKEPYVKYCWSFGMIGAQYIYAVESTPWMEALHRARVFGDLSLFAEFGIRTNGSRQDIVANKEKYKKAYIKWWLQQQKYTTKNLEALIAKCKNDIHVHEEQLRQYLCDALKKSGLTAAEVQRRLGTQMAGHYFGRSQWEFPTQEYYNKMREFLPLSQDYYEVYGLHQLWQSLQSLESLQRLQSLESLQRLQSLESLQRLQSLESLQCLQKDYRTLDIPPQSLIYCDPPYRGTCQNGYGDEVNGKFDYDAFYEWAEKQAERNIVVISEYDMPAERFECIGKRYKACTMGTGNVNQARIEKLFVPKSCVSEYWRQSPRLC